MSVYDDFLIAPSASNRQPHPTVSEDKKSVYVDFLTAADTAAETAYAEWKRLVDERDRARLILDAAYNTLLDLAAEVDAQRNSVNPDLRARREAAHKKYYEEDTKAKFATDKANVAGDFYTKISTARNVVKMVCH